MSILENLSIINVDNFYLSGDAYKAYLDNMFEFLIISKELGFTVNHEIIPRQIMLFLGFVVSFTKMAVPLTTGNSMFFLEYSLRKSIVSLKELARLIAKMVANLIDETYGFLHYLHSEGSKITDLDYNKYNFDKKSLFPKSQERRLC